MRRINYGECVLCNLSKLSDLWQHFVALWCDLLYSNGMDDRYLVDPLLHLAVRTGVLSTSQILVYSNVHGRRAGEA